MFVTQRDSLVKVVSQKIAQITTLTELNLSQSGLIKDADEKNRLLTEQLIQKEKRIIEPSTKQNCISAKTEVSIETQEGLEPKLVLTS